MRVVHERHRCAAHGGMPCVQHHQPGGSHAEFRFDTCSQRLPRGMHQSPIERSAIPQHE